MARQSHEAIAFNASRESAMARSLKATLMLYGAALPLALLAFAAIEFPSATGLIAGAALAVGQPVRDALRR
jgi:hypothetical protein